jgi:hypothetical protein
VHWTPVLLTGAEHLFRAGEAFEAQLENATLGVYHGYPMPQNDDFRTVVQEEWDKRHRSNQSPSLVSRGGDLQALAGVVKCAIQSFLFAASATLLAASFTACFASPASFSALPFAC